MASTARRRGTAMSRAGLCLSLLLLGGALALVFAAPSAAAGEVRLLPAPTVGRVADGAGVLDGDSVQRLNSVLEDLEAQNGVEIGVATVATTAPLTPDQYATELFEAWGVGKRGEDNGLLILVALQERRVKVEVGYGLEGIFPDGRVGRLLDDHAVPALKEGRYGDGLVALASEMARIAAEEYRPGESGRADRGQEMFRRTAGALPGIMLAFFVLVFLTSAVAALRRPVRHRCPRCQGRMRKEHQETLREPTDDADGLARVRYRCTRCGFERVAEVVLPMLVAAATVERSRRFRGPFGGGWGGGGFGGFGGGSFGGGGGGGFGGFGGGRSGGGGSGRGF